MNERVPVTYRDAGVDMDAGEELIDRIQSKDGRNYVTGEMGRRRMPCGTNSYEMSGAAICSVSST